MIKKLLLLSTLLFISQSALALKGSRPNILFIITDDQSWEHLGCYGDPAVRTPTIDRLANEGVRFEHAYCAAPSCSPSRAAIITGQDIWRLEEGGVLGGFIRKKFKCFPLMMRDSGYHIGGMGKRYWPAKLEGDDTIAEPVGGRYDVPDRNLPKELSPRNTAKSLGKFLDANPENKPFFFWIGIGEPHIPYAKDFGKNSGIDINRIKVPDFLPDTPEVRLSLADYLAEIEYADREVKKTLAVLKERGFSDNTLIIFTSDNGLPFPRAKATLYDHGVRMPLIMHWPGNIVPQRFVNDPVSLVDIAPTMLELAGVNVPEEMTGKSLLNIMKSKKSGNIDADRKFVITAVEAHVTARPKRLGYPRRAIHTGKWTYIVNYEQERGPAGTLDIVINDKWGPFGDVDPTPAKFFVIENRDNSEYKRYYDWTFGKSPREQLFNKERDPYMLNNLANDPEHRKIKQQLEKALNQRLRETGDPRMDGKSPWDTYWKNKP